MWTKLSIIDETFVISKQVAHLNQNHKKEHVTCHKAER
jgi:hypothetical protein